MAKRCEMANEELKIKLRDNFLANLNNTMYKQQNLIMAIGELKFIVRIDKESSATDIISEKRERISLTLPLTNWVGCVAPTNDFRFFA